jgi:hypothetical protein
MADRQEPFEEDALLPSARHPRGEGPGAGVFLAGLALGTMLGVGAALFFNSDRGRRVGRYLHDEFDDFRDEAGRQLGRRATRLRKQAGRAARSVKEAIEESFD